MKWDEVPDGVSFAMNKQTAMSLRGSRRGPFFGGMICGGILILTLQSCVSDNADQAPDKSTPSPSVSVRTTPPAQR